jgi:hypothetical protein
MNDNITVKPYPIGVAWGAIIGGAFAAAAISLILLMLGSALGLSNISPWSYDQTVASFTVKAAIWLIIMQWVASAVGGYLTGRLRSKWVGLYAEEVFFRDTAHGFLSWAVATVLTASILASTAASIVGGGVQATATVAAGAASGDRSSENSNDYSDSNGYYIDRLFRPLDSKTVNADAKDVRAEAMRIFAMDIKNGDVPQEDRAYLAQLVSAHAGISSEEATKRVDNAISDLNAAKERVNQEAEAARKTAMHVSIYIFLSMLIGAFIASAAAAIGGKHWDEY